jgi:GH25 family lysozyme M1 (1,4-beta-N-acetylmuramidase)
MEKDKSPFLRAFLPLFLVIAVIFAAIGFAIDTLISKGSEPAIETDDIDLLSGIDVSKHQDGLNLEQVLDKNGKNIDFIMIRATHGENEVDSGTCDRFYQIAKSSGKFIGVYTYLYPQNDAKDEAANFINNIKPAETPSGKMTEGYLGEAILIVDYEETGDELPGTDYLAEFISEVEKLTEEITGTPITPIIYANHSVYNKHLKDDDRFKDCVFWVARYGDNPNRNATDIEAGKATALNYLDEQVRVYQWSEKMWLEGYRKELDFNFSDLTPGEWRQLAETGLLEIDVGDDEKSETADAVSDFLVI